MAWQYNNNNNIIIHCKLPGKYNKSDPFLGCVVVLLPGQMDCGWMDGGEDIVGTVILF